MTSVTAFYIARQYDYKRVTLAFVNYVLKASRTEAFRMNDEMDFLTSVNRLPLREWCA